MQARRRWMQWIGAMGATGATGMVLPLGWPALLSPSGAAAAMPPPPRDAAAGDDDAIRPGRALRFPRDHGAHPGARIEWWYATGWLNAADGAPGYGFQLTFFRSRQAGGAADDVQLAGRFAPRQWLFAHAAITDLAAGRHRHAQRLARWSGDEALPEAHALRADTGLVLGPWQLQRTALPATSGQAGQAGQTSQTSQTGQPAGASRYTARLPAPEAGFTLALTLDSTQPPLLQGESGFSRKGPQPSQASHYYSQPQLAVRADLLLDGRRQALTGTGWLDHEWSDELLAPGAVGWDWIGINLADGSALTAFQLRDRDGQVLWAGGSHRAAGGAVRAFAPAEVVFEPLASWTSPGSGARYPVRWRIRTPAGRHELRALLDAQELDSRASTGAIYWEGLAELRDARGTRVGLGYLEMTGRSAPLKLGA